MTYERALNIYTDGSSLTGPRRGGIAVRYITIDEQGHEVIEDELLPGYTGATNNEMELMACIKALEGARTHRSIELVERVYVFTDSMYVKDNIQRAIFQWRKSKWCNRFGRPIENATLWKDLVKLIKASPKRIDFKWVKGHAKDPHNKAVDKLAKQSAKVTLKPSLKVTAVRRKITAQSVNPGSVPMSGQTLFVRIITDTYMRLQRLYKYKYEVLPNYSQHAGAVDWIYAIECLRAGHHYEIRVNTDGKNPRILEVLRELERGQSFKGM